MITAEDILNMNFYKKEKFTGSYKGMRYLVKKEKDDAENDIFRATVWPGPYNFSTTPDDQKISATFPFTEEGRQQAVDWMNEQAFQKRVGDYDAFVKNDCFSTSKPAFIIIPMRFYFSNLSSIVSVSLPAPARIVSLCFYKLTFPGSNRNIFG